MVVSMSGHFLPDDGPSILRLVRCRRLHVGLDERQKRPMKRRWPTRRRTAPPGQFRPFIHVVARTSERRLHSDSGPSSNDAIRRAVGRCGPIRPIDNDHLRWVRSCAHHVHSGPSVRVADAAHNGVGPRQKENSSPRPSLRLRCPTTRNVDRHVASPLWRCSGAKQS